MKQQNHNKRFLFIESGGHPVHKKFGSLVSKNSVKSSWNLPKNYDIYFVESDLIKVSLLKFFRRINQKAKIITLFADPRLFYLKTNRYLCKKEKKVKKYPFFKKKITLFLLKRLDGAICVGSFEKDLLKKISEKTPSVVVYPFISDERFKKLRKISPNLNNKNIIFIGNGPDYYNKGLDLLIKSFKKIKNKFPNSKLIIVGEWDIKKEWVFEGVNFVGKQKNIENFLKNSCLMIHLGRGEAFGITILEAMVAGIPVIVSNQTGAKEIVEKVRKDFVILLDEKKISKKIEEYFELSNDAKKNLSKKFEEQAKKFNEKEMLFLFKKRFNKLINELENENQ